MKNFDVGKNIVTLLPEWVSRANAKQRSGRAGRLVNVDSDAGQVTVGLAYR